MTQKMNKFNSLKKTTKVDFATYLGVIVVFIITTILQNNGSLKRSAIGLLVPICCYMSMAVSLNLTVGILGEQVEDRRLTGTVRADEAGDLGATDGHIEVVDRF